MLVDLLVAASQLSEKDIIDKTTGPLLFLYYTYLDKFHVRPRDMSDFVDGILYLSGVSYIQKQKMDELKRQADAARSK